MKNHRKSKLLTPKLITTIAVYLFVLIAVVGLFTVNIAPFKAFGGVVWLKNGVHYINENQVTESIHKINAPKEAKIASEVTASTPMCDSLEEGFCQKTQGEYVVKTLVTPAVQYKTGTPDTKIVTGYCTLCNNGQFSPSCAVGRGACSWNGGVASYNVARYRTIPGTPATQAQSAIYNYAFKTYKDSPNYLAPTSPSLSEVVGY